MYNNDKKIPLLTTNSQLAALTANSNGYVGPQINFFFFISWDRAKQLFPPSLRGVNPLPPPKITNSPHTKLAAATTN